VVLCYEGQYCQKSIPFVRNIFEDIPLAPCVPGHQIVALMDASSHKQVICLSEEYLHLLKNWPAHIISYFFCCFIALHGAV